jgi:hypothetical protein
VRAPVTDPALTTDETAYPPPALPKGYHHEIRRCLRPACDRQVHPMASWEWEVVQCFRPDEPVPRYEDVMTTWHGAATYPHTYLVAVSTNWCRRELKETIGE